MIQTDLESQINSPVCFLTSIRSEQFEIDFASMCKPGASLTSWLAGIERLKVQNKAGTV